MIKELNNSHQKRYIDVMKYHSNIPRTIKSVISFRIKVFVKVLDLNVAIDIFAILCYNRERYWLSIQFFEMIRSICE